jgi:hypothetical protein
LFNFTIVDFYGILGQTQFGKYLTNHPDNFGFTEQAICSDHIGITLVKLSVPSFLGAIRSPDGLDLVPLKGKRKFVAVHRDIARKRDR